MAPHFSTLSVLLPVYNGATTLPAALDSLLDQTRPDFEVVAVDDGSIDDTATILERYAQRDPRIKPIFSAHNGIVGALNLGLTHCNAPYIARMDCDDISHPQRLERQADCLESQTDIDLISCRVEFPRCRANSGYARYVDWTNHVCTPDQIRNLRFIESPFAHPSVMFRAELVHRFGGYAAGVFPEDYELWLRWLDNGVNMAKTPETLLTWNDPPDRLSRTDPRCSTEAFYRIKAHYLAKWLQTHNPHHPDIVVWGAGRKTRQRASLLTEQGLRIRAFIDVAPNKIGRPIHGIPVWGPHDLPAPRSCFVVPLVASRGARTTIMRFLGRQGYTLGINIIPAA